MEIGIVGIGLMGKALAEKLLDSGYKVNLFNRSYEKIQNFNNSNSKIYLTANELFLNSKLIIIFLKDFIAIKDVFKNIEPKSLADKYVICMSTILPTESKALSELIEENKGNYIEAPVLGSVSQIKNKELFVFCSGDKNLIDECSSFFETFSQEVRYIGEIGKACALKLAFNQLILSLTVAFSASLSIVMKENIKLDDFLEILRKSALYAPTFDKKLNNYLNNDFTSANFTLNNLLKDSKLILQELQDLNIESKYLEEEILILQKGIENGDAEKDYSVLFKHVFQK